MPYEFYKILHFFGLILTFTALVAFLFLKNSISTQSGSDQTDLKNKKLFTNLHIAHGIGLILVLVSGFGLAAKLGYFSNLPNWIYVKLTLWILAGGIIALLKRKILPPSLSYFLIICIALTGAVFAVTKPF